MAVAPRDVAPQRHPAALMQSNAPRPRTRREPRRHVGPLDGQPIPKRLPAPVGQVAHGQQVFHVLLSIELHARVGAVRVVVPLQDLPLRVLQREQDIQRRPEPSCEHLRHPTLVPGALEAEHVDVARLGHAAVEHHRARRRRGLVRGVVGLGLQDLGKVAHFKADRVGEPELRARPDVLASQGGVRCEGQRELVRALQQMALQPHLDVRAASAAKGEQRLHVGPGTGNEAIGVPVAALVPQVVQAHDVLAIGRRLENKERVQPMRVLASRQLLPG